MRDVGLTVDETAAKCGMSAATLRRYLNGTNHPTIYDLHRIALAVGVPFIGGYPRRGDKSLNDAG
jgi:transcriptional regulator with XRE-family HTH domain